MAAERQRGYFDGLVDDERLYNYPPTDEQAKVIVNEGKAVRF